ARGAQPEHGQGDDDDPQPPPARPQQPEPGQQRAERRQPQGATHRRPLPGGAPVVAGAVRAMLAAAIATGGAHGGAVSPFGGCCTRAGGVLILSYQARLVVTWEGCLARLAVEGYPDP